MFEDQCIGNKFNYSSSSSLLIVYFHDLDGVILGHVGQILAILKIHQYSSVVLVSDINQSSCCLEGNLK